MGRSAKSTQEFYLEEDKKISFCYRIYAKYKRMLNGMLILGISFQNKFFITLGTFGKSVSPGDLMYLKVVPLVSNGHSLEYGVPSVAFLCMHSNIFGEQFAYLFVTDSIGPWGFCFPVIAKLLT